MALLVNNAKGLFGGLVGSDVVVKDFTAKGTLVAGRTVKYDTTQTGEARSTCVVEGGAGPVCGIALEAASSGDRVRCLVSGYITGVLTDGSVTSGTMLVGAASGALAVYAGTEAYGACGTSLEADTSTTSGGIVFRANA